MQFNLADIYESLVDAIPERPVLIIGDRVYTYAELEARANRLANHWKAQGIGRGAHIGLLLYNGAEFIEAMLAAFKLRAVPININYRYVADELNYLFDNADLTALVYERDLSDRVRDAVATLPAMKHFLHVDSGPPPGGDVDGSMAFEDAMAGASEARGFETRSGDDWFIIYTGGTTGMPRGVVWGHENVLFAALQGGNPGGDPVSTPEEIAQNAINAGEGMRIHPAAPLIHGAAQFSFWIGILTGGCCALVPGRSFIPEATCELLDRHRVNVFLVVGDAMARPMVDTILANPGRWAFEELGVINSSGAILSGKVRVRLQSVFPEAMLLNNFGSSESGHQGGAFYDDDSEDAKPQWVMDESVVVLDDDHNLVEPGSGVVGKLARGGRLPECYYKDPEKTARTFVMVGDTRYVIPGDMATVDEEGIITIFGRGAVCINTGGEKVFPEEIEEAMKAHPAVFDVLVVGVPDERWGERVEAVVAVRAGHPFDAAALDAFTRTKVAGYKAPRRFHQVDVVARQPSGKPDYKWAMGVAMSADS